MSSPAPPLPLLTVPPRQKLQKSAPIGIAAGAEDAKYHAKYKELKRKVKDIEADNDKLHFKVLQAKLSIRRTKMERAVLYERLSVVPPSPNLQDRLALPPNAGPPHPPSSRPLIRSSSAMDLDHSHPGNRGLPNNSAPASLNSPRRISAPGPHHHPYPPPPPHLPPMGQVHHHHHSYERHPSHASPPIHHASTSHSRTRSHSSSRSHHHHHHHQAPPPQQYPQGGQQHHYPESLPPVQQPLHSPPLSERERPRRGEQQQQLYQHDYLGGSSHADPHHHNAGGPGPYDYDQCHPGSSTNSTTHHLHSHDSPRASSRIHAHQRLGPGTYVNSRDDYSRGHHEGARDLIAREREHDMMLEREREREFERDPRDIDREYRDRDQDRRYNRSSRETNLHPSATQHSPPHSSSSHSHHHHQHRYSDRSGAQVDYAHGHGHTSRSRGGDHDEPPYRDYRDTTPTHAPYPPPARLSRSGTPGSGSAASGSGGGGAPLAEVPSRPASRSQYYGDSREREYPSSANRSSYNRQVRSGGRGGEDDADFDADGHAREGRSSRGDHPGSTAAAGPPTPGGGVNNNNNNNNNNNHSAASASTSASGNFPVPESRKRTRNDMEVDSDNDVGADGQPSAGGTALYGSRQQDDSRGSKRYHREHRRSADNISTHEDSRMGPS